MQAAKFNAMGIVVADMNASVAFYARLGLEFEVDESMPEHASCNTPNGLHLMLDTEPFLATYTPGWTRAPGGPSVFLAFQLPTPADVDAKYDELTEAGYRGLRRPWDADWGMRYATVLDPDGNGIDLYANLPTGG